MNEVDVPSSGPRVQLVQPRLGEAEFEAIGRIVYEIAGIDLYRGKEALVRNRLVHRLRALGLERFDEYVARLEADTTGAELSELIDAITTNETSFFREPQHFEFLQQTILPELRRRGRPIRIWSAGCSTGEEPYTTAIVLREAIPPDDPLDPRILATDISRRVLGVARSAVYSEDGVSRVPKHLRHRYFRRVGTAEERKYAVVETVRRMVRVARLNLFDPWPMRGPFDVVLCRNVMIYFDRAKQEQLVRRFWEIIAPGGYLFVGHAESLGPLAHAFRYVRPAIYRKSE